MMFHPHLSGTSRTVVVDQLVEVNRRLSGHPAPPPITAADLGLGGSRLLRQAGAVLPDDAVLARLCWDGCPEYPYVHGHFRDASAADDSRVVDLHTPALRALSRRLGLRQQWGTE
jgi:hypothetical protein